MAGEVRHSPHGAQDRAMTTTENECPFCDRIAMRHDLLGANSLCVAFCDTNLDYSRDSGMRLPVSA
jgi:hypothetical protein